MQTRQSSKGVGKADMSLYLQPMEHIHEKNMYENLCSQNCDVKTDINCTTPNLVFLVPISCLIASWHVLCKHEMNAMDSSGVLSFSLEGYLNENDQQPKTERHFICQLIFEWVPLHHEGLLPASFQRQPLTNCYNRVSTVAQLSPMFDHQVSKWWTIYTVDPTIVGLAMLCNI